MDISGIIQSYDDRTTSTTAMTQTAMVPQYLHDQPYAGTTSNTLVPSHQHLQRNPFSYNQAYSIATPSGMIPVNYIQQRPLPRLMQPQSVSDGSKEISYARNNRLGGIVGENQNRTPPIKEEPQSNPPTRSPTCSSRTAKKTTSPLPNGTTDVNFGTEVDTLMKAIQAKSQTLPPQQNSHVNQSRPVVGPRPNPAHVQPFSQDVVQPAEEKKFRLADEDLQDEPSSPRGSKKRYQCSIGGCSRSFYQKTHLDIHIRAHTGDKPYVSDSHLGSLLLHILTTLKECKEPGCGRSFSQLGNLKVRKRRPLLLHQNDFID